MGEFNHSVLSPFDEPGVQVYVPFMIEGDPKIRRIIFGNHQAAVMGLARLREVATGETLGPNESFEGWDFYSIQGRLQAGEICFGFPCEEIKEEQVGPDQEG